MIWSPGMGLQHFAICHSKPFNPTTSTASLACFFGEVVVTSGLDQLFEKGLVVGTVLRVAEPVGLFKDVWVRPSASPAFAEQVFVSLSARERGTVPLP